MKNMVKFGDVSYYLDEEDKNASLEDVRSALAQTYPAVAHAQGSIVTNEDGSKTYLFVEKAGTKG